MAGLAFQLAVLVDGSGSISPADWSIMIEGLACAIENPTCLPHDGLVELTVIQFAHTDTRVEVPPTIVNNGVTADIIAQAVRTMRQQSGGTPLAYAMHLAADILFASPNFNPGLKQILNISTDGEPTLCDPAFDCSTLRENVVHARNYAIATLAMTEQDEIDAEGVGIGASQRNWLRDSIVYPQPGIIAPPFIPGWVRVVADAEEYAETIGEKFAILFFALEARISYYDASNGNLKYAYWDGNAWHIETVDSEGEVGYYTSIAVDSDNCAHISYYDASNGNLKYAYQDRHGWHTETVDSDGDVGWDTSLALDKNGYPHVSYYYYSPTTRALKYAYQDVEGWHIETVDGGSERESRAGRYTSLALDGDSYPHITYVQPLLGLRYARKDGEGWHLETVGDGYRSTSLKLDGDGYPHVAYTNTSVSPAELMHAYQDVEGWHFEIVDTPGDGDARPSLALDESGYAHISYYSNGALEYAHQDGEGWHTEAVEE